MPGLAVHGLAAAFSLILLAAVAGKAHDRAAWTFLVTRVAGPGRRGRVVERALPAAEVAVAVALLAAAGPGLLVAGLLFATLGLGVLALRPSHEGEDCGCFGSLAGGRIGLPLAARNLALAGAALAVGAGGLAHAGPVGWRGALLGAAGAGAYFGALRLAGRTRGVGPRRGARVRVDGIRHGSPAVVAFVSPGCPSCERIAPALAAAAHRLPVLVALAPREGADELGAVLGETVRDGLWEELIRAWRVPGTPYLVAVDAERRVAWSGVGNADTLDAAVEALLRTTAERAVLEPVSRGAVLAGAGRLAAGLGIAALAAPSVASARPRRRPRLPLGGSKFPLDSNPQNVIDGTCEQYGISNAKGVVDALGRRRPGVAGYTFVEGLESDDACKPTGDRLPLATRIDTRRVTSTWRGRCNCPSRQKDYTDRSACEAECPSGLACFGFQCQTTFEEYCVEVLYSITVAKQPKISISTLRWRPPASATARCKVYAESYNQFVQKHEEQHAQDSLDGIKQFEQEHNRRYLKRCAPTEAEADLQISAAIVTESSASYDRLVQIDCQKAASFHQSAQGRAARVNCAMCR